MGRFKPTKMIFLRDGTRIIIDLETGRVLGEEDIAPPIYTDTEYITTSTNRELWVGRPTPVGNVLVTVTALVGPAGIAIAHVEGTKGALTATRLRRLLGSVRCQHPVVPNWHPDRGYFSEWAIRGRCSTNQVVNRPIDPDEVEVMMAHADEWMEPAIGDA